MSRDWINEAQQVIGSGETNLTDVLPSIIAKIIRDDLWSLRKKKDGDAFRSFREFVEYRLWWGLEIPYERLVKYCEHNDECKRLLLEMEPAAKDSDQTILPRNPDGRKGKESDSDPTRLNRGQAYQLRRLKRDRPDLAQKVIDGELTANAAAISAGFIKKYIKVPAWDYDLAIKKFNDYYND